jgi:hypothetical protein
MPMHEERRTASFHILYGQTEGKNIQYRGTILEFSLSQRNSSPLIRIQARKLSSQRALTKSES